MFVKYDLAVSTTRLLILGCVRIFQPVHGYFVRRELLSWHAEEWAHLNPGSVYNALRSLTRDQYLQETGTEAHGGRPARTSYELTSDGETEFLTLLHDALWNVDYYAADPLLAAWSFSWALDRGEVIAALEHRLEQILAADHSAEFKVNTLSQAPDTPAHVTEHVRLTQARLHGEAEWTRELLPRIRAGEYTFADDQQPARAEPQPANVGEPSSPGAQAGDERSGDVDS